MAEKFIPIYLDWLEETEELTEKERGRLVDALVRYARGMSWQESICGNERYLFKVYQGKIDRAMGRHEEIAQRNRENGKNGGRPKKTENSEKLKKPSGFSENPENLSESESESGSGSVSVSTGGGAPENGAPQPQPAAEPSGFLMALNDGGVYDVPLSDVEKYRTLYPAVDVEQQLRAMIGWLDANPTRRKTRRGIKAFIANWLNNAQNRGSGGGYGGKGYSGGSGYDPHRPDAAQGYQQREYTDDDWKGFVTDVMHGEGDE